MKLIVGLGNPGKEYINTRHNVGFMVLDYFLGNNLKWKEKFNGLYYESLIEGEKVIFLKPLTFMNLSGEAVVKYKNYFNLDIEDILVIHDDMDIDLGKYKLKRNSSSGGHNGIKSIINSLNSNAFLRLKIGITHNKNIDTVDYVLGKFNEKEMDLLKSNFRVYEEIIRSFVVNGIDKTMNIYNTK